MQFVLIGRDDDDEQALMRRFAARDAHIAGEKRLVASGNQYFGVVLLNEQGEMAGSLMILDFPSRQELDAWLKTEPYILGKVWKHIEILPCQVGPFFSGFLPKHNLP